MAELKDEAMNDGVLTEIQSEIVFDSVESKNLFGYFQKLPKILTNAYLDW